MTGWELVGTFGSFAAALVAIFIFVFNKVADKSEWKGKVDSDRTAFRKFMEEVREDIREIRADIKKIFERLTPLTATTGSPLRLTDLGKKVSEEIEAKEWARELAETLADELKNKTPFEIQETCRKYCFDMKRLQPSEERLALCGTSAYENGIELKQVYNVLGLELRDIVLQRFGLAAQNKRQSGLRAISEGSAVTRMK